MRDLKELLSGAAVERAKKGAIDLDRLRADLAVEEFSPAFVDFARANVGRIQGPFSLRGIGAPEIATCGKLFGRFGDAPFPALRIGSDGAGVDFWLTAGGRVITLHHDASFYEEAARCRGATVDAFMDAFVARGSAFDLTQLVQLQIALHQKKWSSELERQQVWARTAAEVLGVTLKKLIKLSQTLPFELLHLEQQVVEELAAEKKPGKRSKLPPQLEVARDARTLDLAGLLDKQLPEEILEFSQLEEIDLSENPRLDFEDAFDKLSRLRVRRVKFDDCRMEALPKTTAKLQSLEELDLSGSMLKGPHNFFVLDQVLPILKQLPNLKALDISVSRGPEDFGAFVAALPQLERLKADSVSKPGYGCANFALAGSAALTDLSLRHLGVDGLLDIEPQRFPRLARLNLEQASISARSDSDDWDERDRLQGERVVQLIEWLAKLPSLRALDLRLKSLGVDDLPDAIAKLRVEELWLNCKKLPAWIGKMRTLRALHLGYQREVLPPEIGALENLETLDCSGLGSDELARFTTLPEEIGKLQKLRTLKLRNKLERWPESLRNCRSLEELDCVDGPPFLAELTTLKKSSGAIEQLVRLPLLERIELSGAKHIPKAISKHAGLREVDWWAYDLEDDFAEAFDRILAIPSLEALDLGSLPVARLPESLARAPLRKLSINMWGDGPALDLESLMAILVRTRIEELAFHVRQQTELPESLADLSTLRKLSLWGLGFSKLPSAIGKLAQLRHITLRETKIGAPERKRVRSALPGCRVTVYD